MKRRLWLCLILSTIANIALAIPTMNAAAVSVPFTFSQPTQIGIKNLPGRGVLAIYVNSKSFGAESDPVVMTCGNGSEGSIRVFPGEIRYCSAEFNKVSATLLAMDFKNGASGIITRKVFE